MAGQPHQLFAASGRQAWSRSANLLACEVKGEITQRECKKGEEQAKDRPL